jgi:hypothetical protein
MRVMVIESAVSEAGGAALSVRCPRGTAQTTGRPGTPARALAAEVLTALGERDGAVQDAEPRAGFRRGLLVALIRPVTGHGHAAQLEGQRPARQVREPNASGSRSSSKSISSCTFMIPSTSPGRDVPVIEKRLSPVEIESGRVSAVHCF